MRIRDSIVGQDGTIEVLEYRRHLALVIDSVFQTVMPLSTLRVHKGMLLRGGDHTELLPWLRPATATALFIGLGGGLQAKALKLYDISATAVEIDPAVVRIAREHFGVSFDVVIGDGRDFLERDPRLFDAIVLDAFAGADLPEHLFTRKAFEAASRRLEAEGVLVVHLLGRPDHPAVRLVARTIETVFPHLLATRSGTSDEVQAIYLFASNTPFELGPWVRAELDRLGFTGKEILKIDTAGIPVLLDSDGTLSNLARDIAEAHRRRSLEIRRNPPWQDL